MSDPAMKFMSPEIQCIIGVLDECVNKMDLLSLLSLKLLQSDSLISFGAMESCSLEKHLQLCNAYQSTQDEDSEMGAMSQTSMTRDIQNSLLDFLRVIKARGVQQDELGRNGTVTKEDQWPIQQIREGIQDLMSIILVSLLTTPTQEWENKRQSQIMSVRHQSNLDLIDKLEKEVASVVQERDEQMKQKTEVIKSMRLSLQQIEKGTEDYVTKIQTDSQQENQSDQKNSERKCQHLQQEIDQLQAQLHNLMTKHRNAQGALRKKKYKLETEIENWIQKYDADMGVKQTKLESLGNMFEEEKAELQELQEHYAMLELEYSQIVAEHQRAQELKEKEEKETEAKCRAAVVIQAVWRGWCVRRAMKNKTKGKNKKSKSKAKKK